MNIFIAHALNNSLDSIDLYFLQNNKSHIKKINGINDLSELTEQDLLIFLVPSSLITSYRFTKNKDLSSQINLANFISNVDENLVGQVSDNKFLFHNDNGFVINKFILESINKKLTSLSANIQLMPEHCLFSNGDEDEIFEIGSKFIFSFADGTGFSINEESLEQYSEVILNNRPDFNPKIYSNNNFLSSKFETLNLSSNNTIDNLFKKNFKLLPNFFNFTFSFNAIKSKFDFSRTQILACMVSFVILLSSPSFLIYKNNNDAALYRDSTFNIFKSINQDINRVVAPRVQIDEILQQVPNLRTSQKINLPNLDFLDQLGTAYIQNVKIDVINSTSILTLKDMPSFQFNVIKKLSAQFNITILNEDIVSLDGMVNGNITMVLEDE